MSTSTAVRVSETSEQLQGRKEREASGKPDHWVNGKATAFQNPWKSWRTHTTGDIFNLIFSSVGNRPSIPDTISSLIPVQKPTWGLKGAEASENQSKIKATWLGHACFLVELPSRSTAGASPLSRGARILFDPVFSDRCSPSQWVGPKRYTPPPCDIKEIPEVDAIVISHNHYDHLDTHTIRTLFQRPRTPHIFAPLGNAAYFHSLGVPKSHTHTLDWWESRRCETEVALPDKPDASEGVPQKVTFDVTCTPAQHFTGRGILDRNKSLWASWAVQEVLEPSSSTPTEAPKPGAKVYFAGDTGYRAVLDGQNEDEVPTCPAFKEIGDRFGGFDLAMIPIGAYLPREFMSPIHCAPQESVRLFKDVRAKKGLGMHWGAWILTTEDVTEPPKRLAEECTKNGIEEGAFTVCDIGETTFF